MHGKLIAGYVWDLRKYSLEKRENHTLDNDNHIYKGGSTHDSTDDFKFNFGIDMQLGYHATNKWMPYVLTGWQIADCKHTETNHQTGKIHGHQKYLNGFQAGAGINYTLTKHLSSGINYTYSKFESDHIGGSNHSETLVYKKVQPTVQQVTWDIYYNF